MSSGPPWHGLIVATSQRLRISGLEASCLWQVNKINRSLNNCGFSQKSFPRGLTVPLFHPHLISVNATKKMCHPLSLQSSLSSSTEARLLWAASSPHRAMLSNPLFHPTTPWHFCTLSALHPLLPVCLCSLWLRAVRAALVLVGYNMT